MLRGKNQRAVLDHLYQHGTMQGDVVTNLSEATGIKTENQIIHSCLWGLNKEGYVRVEKGNFEGRNKIVSLSLTPEGVEAIEEVYVAGKLPMPDTYVAPAWAVSEPSEAPAEDSTPEPEPAPAVSDVEPDWDALAAALLRQVLEQVTNPPVVDNSEAEALAQKVADLKAANDQLRERSKRLSKTIDNLEQQYTQKVRELEAMTDRYNKVCEQRNALEQKVRTATAGGSGLKPEAKAALAKLMRELPSA